MIEVEHIATGDKCCFELQTDSDCRRSIEGEPADTILWPIPEDYNPATHTYLETGDADCATCLD